MHPVYTCDERLHPRPKEGCPLDKRPIDKNAPPWRETPLDHWSTDIDPVLMAGDEWVNNDSDPGTERILEGQGGTRMGAQFMHPMHDTTYQLEQDVFTSESESD